MTSPIDVTSTSSSSSSPKRAADCHSIVSFLTMKSKPVVSNSPSAVRIQVSVASSM